MAWCEPCTEPAFSVDAGKTLGIVGESGSGKSVACLTMMGLVRGGQVSGQVRFDGRDVLAMRDDDRRRLRGAEIGIVFQDPLSSLHPLYKVGLADSGSHPAPMSTFRTARSRSGR